MHFISGESLRENLCHSQDICSDDDNIISRKLSHHFPLDQLKLHWPNTSIMCNPFEVTVLVLFHCHNHRLYQHKTNFSSNLSVLPSDILPTYTYTTPSLHVPSLCLITSLCLIWPAIDLFLCNSVDGVFVSIRTPPRRSYSGTVWAGWGEPAPRPPTARRGLCCPSYARWHC